jgi:hypothetical protein
VGPELSVRYDEVPRTSGSTATLSSAAGRRAAPSSRLRTRELDYEWRLRLRMTEPGSYERAARRLLAVYGIARSES